MKGIGYQQRKDRHKNAVERREGRLNSCTSLFPLHPPPHHHIVIVFFLNHTSSCTSIPSLPLPSSLSTPSPPPPLSRTFPSHCYRYSPLPSTLLVPSSLPPSLLSFSRALPQETRAGRCLVTITPVNAIISHVAAAFISSFVRRCGGSGNVKDDYVSVRVSGACREQRRHSCLSVPLSGSFLLFLFLFAPSLSLSGCFYFACLFVCFCLFVCLSVCFFFSLSLSLSLSP